MTILVNLLRFADMGYHPEASESETFVGNTTYGISHLASLKSARLGNAAYYLDGGKIPADQGYRPVIIAKAEADAYDRIMMARFSAIRASA